MIHTPNEKFRSNRTKRKEKKDDRCVALMDFKVGEVIWAKMRGYPAWPAKIERIYGANHQMVEIFWFNDYRRSKILKAQCSKFHSEFETNSKIFNKHIGLETAAKEAMIYAIRTLGK